MSLMNHPQTRKSFVQVNVFCLFGEYHDTYVHFPLNVINITTAVHIQEKARACVMVLSEKAEDVNLGRRIVE